ncbi:hypothetical protein OG455_09025 [Kitasatospora sp. NBC_01287]|uniref:hypothetical protein n=1 Tax=Kitasatospora sp. NBC_01287 TaxID=2903573 RepID=UPI002254F8BD|nr:hypothetical protein [Kitasatospora sp. NBC_01287]MCX4745662.1 hypothetical protein [Kitasatospora sp. NBC_01287]
MPARKTPPPTLYTPQPNELVRDEKHGLTGHYMGPGYAKHPTVYLRPPGGGCEWETPASEIQPLGPATDLRPTRTPR